MYLHGNIRQIGKKARSFLLPGQHGTVLASVSKAIYLIAEQGDAFWLAGEDTPMHDRCAMISTAVPALSPGARYSVEQSALIVDDTFAFEAGDAAIWSPAEIHWHLGLTELAANTRTFVRHLDGLQASGFGKFLPLIQALWQEIQIPDLQFADPILQFSKSRVLDIAAACLEQDIDRFSENARMLIGLGTGLTPSGDDFLGGVLFALRTIQTHYPCSSNLHLTFSIENYSSQTHPISFTLLKDLANGSAVEPLHEMINNLLGGTSIDCTSSFVSQLTNIGHSTGWDMLTGLLTGLLVTHGNHVSTSSLPIKQSMKA
jgi:Protein of unknown function (DUF2877)